MSQAVTFGAYIVLAHLLSPGMFGSFAAGSVLITFGILFAESGVMAALISRRDRIEEAASTAFFWLLASGLALSLLSLAASPLVGLFFRNRTAGDVAAALSGWLLLRSLTIVPDSLLQRRLSFARRAVVDPLGAIAFASVAIGACAAGAGVWGLVGAVYASEIAEVAAAWAFARFRPRWKLASIAMWRETAAFARPVLGSEILRRVANQMDVILLGRFSGAPTLGQYRNGYRLASQPVNAFVDVGAYVLLPVLTQISSDAQHLNAVVRRAYRVGLALAVPVSFAMAPLGVPVAVLFLGHRWQPAGHAIAALWGMLLGGAISSIAAEVAKAIGRPALLVRIHAVNLAVTAALVAAGVPFGLVGVAIAVSVSQVLVGLYAFGRVAPFVGMGWRELAGELVSPFAASAGMVAAMLAFSTALDPLARGEATGLLLTAAEIAIGALAYGALLATIDESRRAEMRVAARRFRSSFGPN